jgi:hypothetical protein
MPPAYSCFASCQTAVAIETQRRPRGRTVVRFRSGGAARLLELLLQGLDPGEFDFDVLAAIRYENFGIEEPQP